MRRSLIGLVVCFCLLASVVKAGDEPVEVKSDKIWGDNRKNLTYLSGNVSLKQGSNEITTESAEVDLHKKIAIFKNKLQLTSSEVIIGADRLEYNLKAKTGTFLENVVLYRKELKDDRGNVTQDSLKLSADNLYFESDTRNFQVPNQGLAEHKDFRGTADFIAYNDKRQELTFLGNAKIKRPSGEEIVADEVIINTLNNSIIAKKRVRLVHEDVMILGDELRYDYREKHGVFSSKVVLERAETKDSAGKVVKDHFKLSTVGLEFDSDSKDFATGGPGRVEHKDFIGFADLIEYRDKLQQMKLIGEAYLKRPEGEEVCGERMTVFIQDKSFTVSNHVDIHYQVDPMNENQTSKKENAFRDGK